MKRSLFFGLFVFVSSVFAQNTVGVTKYTPNVYDGYTFFSPNGTTTSYLIDNCGRKINEWQGNHRPALSAYLTEEGDLLQTCWNENDAFPFGGNAGRVERYDWDGNLIWEYNYSTDSVCTHHDIELLPNGNILMVAWEKIPATEAYNLGRATGTIDDTELLPEHIIEVQPTGSSGGTIVWEWHVLDHLIQEDDLSKPNYGVVADHPEKVNLNFYRNNRSDWLHINGIDYNPSLDQIVVSVKNFSEVWVIDHSTTTQEAKGSTGGNSGMGGDLLYRWGNPQTYNRGTEQDQVFDNQHDAQWVPAGYPNEGDLMVYNNGSSRGYSSADRITPPLNGYRYTVDAVNPMGPVALNWSYDGNESFYSAKISGVTPLQNGHHLICVGAGGRFIEVDENDEVVWQYVNPMNAQGFFTQGQLSISGNSVFRAYKYPPSYAAFAGRDLTPGDYLELEPTPICTEATLSTFNPSLGVVVYPNPATELLYIQSKEAVVSAKLIDLNGKVVYQQEGSDLQEVFVGCYSKGVYILQLQTHKQLLTKEIIVE